MPDRLARLGDPWAGIDDAAGSLDPLLALAGRDTSAGLPDAPWPPHFVRQDGEAPRVQPSRRARPGPPAPGQRLRPRGSSPLKLPLCPVREASIG